MKKFALITALLVSFPFSYAGNTPEDTKKGEKSNAWYHFFTGNIKKGTEKAVMDTGTELVKDIILKPYLIKPIKKMLGLDQDSKTALRVKFMLKLSRSIDELKKAGASKKQIAEISAKLATELNKILDYLNKKK